ncbi:oligoendopeptidase F [Brevibacillus humidisoli]|uniref:oligoendopeptidase F n=1 Tax=Brevibacillus humidisoli TaxID=2895522 RepID=UPI001E29035B|nr:oligoendopeptidase F [Brevibacillus humidisoli]UFJ40432.1 oligoendopeptidase F [Brevibacillus humidisoli]
MRTRFTIGMAIVIAISLIVSSGLSDMFIPGLSVAETGKQEMPQYNSREEIPEKYKWNLQHIYPDQKAWVADKRKLEKQINSFDRHQGTLADSPAALASALEDTTAISRLFQKLYVYAKLGLDVDTTNPERQALFDQADKLNALVLAKTAWLGPEILSIPTEQITRLMAAQEVAPYRRFLQQILQTEQHSLPTEKEQLLAKTVQMALIPEKVYSAFMTEIPMPKVVDEEGRQRPLTNVSFPVYLQSPDRQLRKSAFTAYYQTLATYQNTFAETLSGEVEANNLYATVHNYRTALEASLKSNEIPIEVYEQLLETVNEHLPLLHRYMELKKRSLGVKEMHMYDVYAPLSMTDEPYIPYEQAKEMVLQGVAPLGRKYVDALNKGFVSRWIDVYPSAGKRSGAYHLGSYDTHPYVFLNYMGTSDDVSTLAHELGHAMQSYYTNQNQPYLYADYPIFTAEVASTLNEILLFESRYKRAATKQEKIRLLDQFLESFRTTLFRQTQFAEFEKMIHEKDQAGESLTADAMKRMYHDLNKKYYGPHVVSDSEIAMEWARIPHFYRNFYVYQYATSFAASVALAETITREGKPAVNRVLDHLLSAGSSVPPLQILRASGVDMSTAAPIKQAMVVFEQKLAELERLLNEK